MSKQGIRITRENAKPLAALVIIYMFLSHGQDNRERQKEEAKAAIDHCQKCQLQDAKNILEKLESEKANFGQIQKVKNAIDQATPVCEKKQQKANAWRETKAAIDSALKQDLAAKASSALTTYTERWGSDSTTYEQKVAIELHQAQALVDIAETCLNREDLVCAEQHLSGAERDKHPELKLRIINLRHQLQELVLETPSAYAARINKEMKECLARGAAWSNKRCLN